MAGIVIERIEVAHVEVKIGGERSFGELVDEQLGSHVRDGRRVQSITIHLSEEDWAQLYHLGYQPAPTTRPKRA